MNEVTEEATVRTIEEDSLMLDRVANRLLSLLDSVANVDRPGAAVDIARVVRDVIYTKAQISEYSKGVD